MSGLHPASVQSLTCTREGNFSIIKTLRTCQHVHCWGGSANGGLEFPPDFKSGWDNWFVTLLKFRSLTGFHGWQKRETERENKKCVLNFVESITCCAVACWNMFSWPLPSFNNHVLNMSNILVPSMWRRGAILFQGFSNLKSCDFQDMFSSLCLGLFDLIFGLHCCMRTRMVLPQ